MRVATLVTFCSDCSYRNSKKKRENLSDLRLPQLVKIYKIGKKIEFSEIPAKKWGDTEIAERGRSVLVMRASYRSAGLTPHQRGWTDAG